MSHMNRMDLVNAVHEKLQGKTPKATIDAVIKAEEDAKLEALASGRKVQLLGFGTYETRKRAARKGRNPQTGEEVQIAEQTTVAFKPGKRAKDHVKK